MRKITEYLGKPVLSLYESGTEGIVKDLVFDKPFKKLKYIVLFTDNEFQEEKLLNVVDIYSYGENAIVIKNNTCLELKSTATDETTNPINNYAYTTQGKFVGIVSDVIIDEKNNIEQIVLDNNQTVELSKIVKSGKDALFIQDEDNIVKLSNFKKRTIINDKENEKIKVKIQAEQTDTNTQQQPLNNTPVIDDEFQLKNNEVETVNDEIEPIKPKKKITLEQNQLPTKKTTKNNFLIGRKVTQNIYSFNHELIIKKNTRITEKTIVVAKSHSKLKELSLYSN